MSAAYRVHITVEAGQARPRECELNPARPTTLGRSRSSTIVLQDERASRAHAEIVARDGKWYLRDCDTLNGTYLDGERLKGEACLESGQLITIGSIRLRIALGTTDEVTSIEPLRAHRTGPETPRDTLRESPATVLGADVLTDLCQFMTRCVREAEPRVLVRLALEALSRQTQASLCGFLSLDPEEPLPKEVFPEQACVDAQLSRYLTQEVQHTGRAVWLGEREGDMPSSESLLSFSDALCVPLAVDGTTLGALHLYKKSQSFQRQEVHYAELVAGFVAGRLGRLHARRSLEAENSRLRAHSPAAEELIGASPALQLLRQAIARLAARSGSAVLIRGESGVGKELVALAIHRQSARRHGPLVVVNCAAISATLLEAELFGYRKGAFTGAERDYPGLFQQADEGTLFLDEVGDLSAECQAKLLRVIEGKSFRPVGATADVQTDVRVLTATHRDLEEQVRSGGFREDLYYRLAGLPILVPPLREHAEDIPALAAFFLGKLNVECGRRVRLSEAALRRLQNYPWPGNVRQLRSVLENAVTFCDKVVLEPEDLLLPSGLLPDQPTSLDLEDLELWAIRQAFLRSPNNVSQAARLLGIHRETLLKKMKKYGIAREEEG